MRQVCKRHRNAELLLTPKPFTQPDIRNRGSDYAGQRVNKSDVESVGHTRIDAHLRASNPHAQRAEYPILQGMLAQLCSPGYQLWPSEARRNQPC